MCFVVCWRTSREIIKVHTELFGSSCWWMLIGYVTYEADWLSGCGLSAMEFWCVHCMWWSLCLLCNIGCLYLPGMFILNLFICSMHIWWLTCNIPSARFSEIYLMSNDHKMMLQWCYLMLQCHISMEISSKYVGVIRLLSTITCDDSEIFATSQQVEM